MPIYDYAFADRARAESFGSVAAQYDRFRPTYPDELLNRLVALAGRPAARTLDLACGTGKVAVDLRARGLDVLGVEPDPKMAEVARGYGVPVETAEFERWDDRGRTFELITCGQGWHWIDPAVGAPKAARLLAPGATLALFWNYDDTDADLQRSFDEIYQQHTGAPDEPHEHRRDDQRPYVDAIAATSAFPSIETERFRWQRSWTAEQWVGRIATHSGTIRLPTEQREPLLAALGAEIERRGGSIDSRFTTYAIFARTTEL